MIIRFAHKFFNVQHDEQKFTWIAIFILLFNSLISISPLMSLLGMGGVKLLGLQLMVIILLFLLKGRNIKKIQVYGFIVLFGLSLLPAFYWVEPRLAIYPIFFFLSILILGLTTLKEIDIYIDIASWFVLVLLIGGIIGFVLAFIGIEPIFEFENRDGRLNYLFYTTFTNSYWGFLIRPSGIYDEPGTLAFFVACIIFFRHIAQKDFRLTWTLLILGFITFSLAFLIFAFVFLLSERVTKKKIRVLFISSFIVLLLLIVTGILQEIMAILNSTILNRLHLDTENVKGLTGRTSLFENSLNLLVENKAAIFWGADPDCTLNIAKCIQKYGYISDNPLGPLAQHGIFLSWPYYIFLAVVFYYSLRGRKHLAFLAVGLLFLQRPYVIHYGYSFYALLALWIQINRYQFKDHNNYEDELDHDKSLSE